MINPNIYLFLAALFYVVVLQILSFVFIKKKISLKPRHPLLFIFLLAFLLRFLPVVFFPFGSGYDISSFRWAGEKVFNKEDIYYNLDVRHRYAFFPTFALLLSGSIRLSETSGIPFIILEKLPIIIFDSLIAVLIFKISRSFNKTIIYAVSPISIIVGAYTGQFDSIPLFFLLLALYLLSYQNYFPGYILLALGTIVKPWPIIFTPLSFLKEKSINKKLLMISGFLIPVISVLIVYQLVVDKPNIRNLFLLIPLYDSVVGWWGISLILGTILQTKALHFLANCAKIFVISTTLILAKYTKTQDLFLLSKWIILIIYNFSLGLSIHYFLWILPFALLTKDSLLKYYLLFTGAYLIFFDVFGGLNYNFKPPYTPQIFYLPASLLLWIFFIYWGVKELRLQIKSYIVG